MGTLDDTKAKIAVIWNTIDKVISSDSFTKSDIERLIPMVCGNNRQPLKAGFDILEKLGYIQKLLQTNKNKCIKYRKTDVKPIPPIPWTSSLRSRNRKTILILKDMQYYSTFVYPWDKTLYLYVYRDLINLWIGSA
jgi:hypothetical protein